jgi:cellulose synthase/poly-beta-1,6-N-acetylglucosamine synthase-like glycosyltransferase/peptidoglycan/xylan/chitin deacetylase (PgdA/CDA1 family)
MRTAGVPVFYDAKCTRKKWVTAICVVSLTFLSAAAAWLITSLLLPPVLLPWIAPPDAAAPASDATDSDPIVEGVPIRRDGNGEVLAPLVIRNGSQPDAALLHHFGGGEPDVDLRTVLTFDDGPDPTFTPQVLDVLKKYHVPAIFFVVGKNAEEHPDLLARMVREGHEIGNHTFSHPDLSTFSAAHQDFELTLTQRIIQAAIGRSTLFFRPPYGGNPEPRSAPEVVPILRAGRLGYVTVGQGINPADWQLSILAPGVQTFPKRQLRTPDEVADRVIRSRNEGHVILLHDAGGNRALTVAALPLIITRLQGMGHTFVSLSDLCGISKETSMPPIAPRDRVLVAGNHIILSIFLPFQRGFSLLFLIATCFAIFRIGFLLVLVLLQRPREKRRIFSDEYTPTVTVIMAAYNEEKVITGSLRSLLDSEYPALNIVVVDDGSTDSTLRLLRDGFGDDPRVRILHQKNAGKMAAMNRALREAEGEILMLADADTLFPPPAIGLLARHFVDRRIGAVAAGVRIGNAADNTLTRWQALEYSTCQNFDRRGYDLLNCIPVIAGAAGAVRRDAINALGGFSPDTLNEDMDMTWQLLRAGWRIVNDSEAVAYTEAPNTLNSFIRQRFRWAYGTLQCLWKHRDALGRYGTLGWVALPIQWLHQVLMPTISPFVDALMIYSLCSGRGGTVALFGFVMLAAEGVAAAVAISMGAGNPRLLAWLPAQRVGYHPFMWYVVAKAIFVALCGTAVGWNKFARAGTAEMGGDGATQAGAERVSAPEVVVSG